MMLAQDVRACVGAREGVANSAGFQGGDTFSTALRLLQLRHTWSARKTNHKL